jgi:mRNA interferase MazF
MRQGEIWDITLDNNNETDRGEKCSVIVINDDTISILPSRVIVPLTDWQDKFDKAIWLIRVDPNDENNLDRISAVDAFQVQTIPTIRFIKKIGMVSFEELQHIRNAVKAIINAE